MDTVTVDTLAEVLQEPNHPLLAEVLRVLGQDRCRAILADTLQCEAHGGVVFQMCTLPLSVSCRGLLLKESEGASFLGFAPTVTPNKS